jgi:GAF domain-containing protein
MLRPRRSATRSRNRVVSALAPRVQEYLELHPLRTRDGCNLGTLCILGIQPRTLSHRDLKTLEDLAAIVMNDLEQRLQSRRPA